MEEQNISLKRFDLHFDLGSVDVPKDELGNVDCGISFRGTKYIKELILKEMKILNKEYR